MGEQRDLISIVIPVYNEEAAIGEDLDTILETMEARPLMLLMPP